MLSSISLFCFVPVGGRPLWPIMNMEGCPCWSEQTMPLGTISFTNELKSGLFSVNYQNRTFQCSFSYRNISLNKPFMHGHIFTRVKETRYNTEIRKDSPRKVRSSFSLPMSLWKTWREITFSWEKRRNWILDDVSDLNTMPVPVNSPLSFRLPRCYAETKLLDQYSTRLVLIEWMWALILYVLSLVTIHILLCKYHKTSYSKLG